MLVFLILIPTIASNSDNSQFINIYYGDYDESIFEKCVNIPVVAAINDTSGLVGTARICLLKTNNNMIVLDARTSVDQTTIESIIDAIKYVEKRTGVKNDYFISYDLNSRFVSGKSTGASIALGMITLIENKDFSSFIITGAINEQGDLLETGGLLIKILSVSKTPITNIIVANGQKSLTVYEQYNNRFLAKNIDLFEYAKKLEINYIEIKNIGEGILLTLNEKV